MSVIRWFGSLGCYFLKYNFCTSFVFSGFPMIHTLDLTVSHISFLLTSGGFFCFSLFFMLHVHWPMLWYLFRFTNSVFYCVHSAIKRIGWVPYFKYSILLFLGYWFDSFYRSQFSIEIFNFTFILSSILYSIQFLKPLPDNSESSLGLFLLTILFIIGHFLSCMITFIACWTLWMRVHIMLSSSKECWLLSWVPSKYQQITLLLVRPTFRFC